MIIIMNEFKRDTNPCVCPMLMIYNNHLTEKGQKLGVNQQIYLLT